jgi:4-hydroxy-3-polyprenylbenzoate decarboxylase
MYKNTLECCVDLERNGQLIRIKEEIDPYLEMAAVHLRVHEMGGPAILFENVKGSKFMAASNLFGTIERSKFIFRDSLQKVQQLIELRNNPAAALKNPLSLLSSGAAAIKALPRKHSSSALHQFYKTSIQELPQLQCWKNDGGAFVTLPIVYTEDADAPGVMNSNIGMYRIQLSGNEYELNKEIGLHYQLHRGIGVHQSKWNKKGEPMKVSIFVGGPPAHTVASVMPLPEGLSEVIFGGVLGNKRFGYCYDEHQNCISTDADFVITGYVMPHETKPEGPFGDHLGYYSLKHEFPLMHVTNVYHRKDAVWPFTVVGRPPQEDTSFGKLIHEITGSVIPKEIPGLKEVYAVDAAGVHPLLFAIGSERYTPYVKERKPAELLTIANHALGKGQLSLAKYLFIAAHEDDEKLSTHQEEKFLEHILQRIDFTRDIHFYTKTSIDTLDYSGEGLNEGSKVVIAAAGEIKRTLATSVPASFTTHFDAHLVMKGVVAVKLNPYITHENAVKEIEILKEKLIQEGRDHLKEIAMISVCDDAAFVAQKLNNFLWVAFTRSNPSHDIYGIDEFIDNKHWACRGAMIIDARIKPHHAPVLEKDPATEKKVDRLFEKGGSLYGLK